MWGLLLVLVGATAKVEGQNWFDDFKELSAIYDKLDDWSVDHSAIVSPLTIGQSYEGRDIRGVRISTGGANKPTVLLNGTQHAREWISPMTNMFVGEQLLDAYGTDPEITSVLDNVDVVVLPVVNPDGYEYSWSTDRDWRKNRRPIGSTGAVGVDLNRNWGVGWGLDSGSSNDPFDWTYRGPSPFSEPETAALRDFYIANQNIVSNIDFHAYSQLILYPFGYSDTQVPPDAAMLAAVAQQMSDSIADVYGEYYEPVSASELYLASGVSIDWTYGDQSVYSYTIELRPDAFIPGFELPAHEIIPTGEENMPAVMDLLNFTMQLAAGDFNFDGSFDCEDLGQLVDAAIHGTNKAEFDHNRDGVVGMDDLPSWLAAAGEFVLGPGEVFQDGDANLDGVVDGSDFLIWNEHRFTPDSNWCHGDFNADGFVDGLDFLAWNANRFDDNRLLAVPEPTGVAVWCVGGMLALVRFRFSRQR